MYFLKNLKNTQQYINWFFLTGKYLVFFFYPLDFTFVCPTEILAFNDRVEEFRKLGAEVRVSQSRLWFHCYCTMSYTFQVVACSVDSHFTHLAWMNTPRKEGGLGRLDIPLLSDLTHAISKDYGVYLEENGHTLRGLFIIDPEGTLRFREFTEFHLKFLISAAF